MPAYKDLYQQQLKKNKEHEEKIYELETKIVDLVDVRDIAEILGEDPEHYINECCAYTLAKKIKEHKEMEEENKKLKEQVKKLKEENKKLKEEKTEYEEDIEELSESKEILAKEYKKNKIEIVKQKEQVEYWKNFALTYWSGDQLGDLTINTSGSDVWCEALDECESNSDYDRKALTEKCLL